MQTGEWSGEVLVPSANLIGYQLVYEAETWLRRICLAALLLAHGPAWVSTLDARLRNSIRDNSRRNSERWYLGVDAEEELLWSTTHSQLSELLSLASIADQVARLCGLTGRLLSDRLSSVAQVRNALAHNRAISEDTLTVLRGDLAVIRSAVDWFKGKTLYADSTIYSADPPQDLESVVDQITAADHVFPEQQLFVAANDDFVFLVRLPVDPFCQWLSAARLRDALGIASHLLVCVLANKQGDEMQLVMPRNLAESDKLEVVKRFLDSRLLRSAWTERPPDEQHPADVCWPRLWYYENQRPQR